MMHSQKVVTPAKAGVQMFYNYSQELDSGFRRNDGKMLYWTFYESINNVLIQIQNTL